LATEGFERSQFIKLGREVGATAGDSRADHVEVVAEDGRVDHPALILPEIGWLP
jgi:hypothetical protein